MLGWSSTANCGEGRAIPRLPAVSAAVGQAPLKGALSPVEVDRDHFRPCMGECNRDMKRQRRLADASLFVGEGDDVRM